MTKSKNEPPFVISFETAVLESIRVQNKVYTKVTLNSGEEFVVNIKPYDIIKKSCSHYGTIIKLIKKNSRDAIGNHYKLPLVISHDYGIPCIFFPTLSEKSDFNVWFALEAVQSYSRSDDGGCSVVLKNGKVITVSSSPATITTQLSKSFTLKNIHQSKMRKLSSNSLLPRIEPF